jgi:phosphoglycolate phosphatase-like HAD superfamily hydrolase
MVSKGNLGMATGRGEVLTKYTLGNVFDRLNPEACVFAENVEEYQRRVYGTETGINLKKPHPFSLLKAAEGLKSFQHAMYVGDSMEDIIMVKRANEISPRFMSVGVYASSDFREELISDFSKSGVDVILPSVNELPWLMREVRERIL